MIKTKVAFLKGRLLSSQLEQFKKYSKCSDWLEKSRPSKKSLLFWSSKQAIHAISHLGAKQSTLVVTQLDERHANRRASVWEWYDKIQSIQHLVQTEKKVSILITISLSTYSL